MYMLVNLPGTGSAVGEFGRDGKVVHIPAATHFCPFGQIANGPGVHLVFTSESCGAGAGVSAAGTGSDTGSVHDADGAGAGDSAFSEMVPDGAGAGA